MEHIQPVQNGLKVEYFVKLGPFEDSPYGTKSTSLQFEEADTILSSKFGILIISTIYAAEKSPLNPLNKCFNRNFSEQQTLTSKCCFLLLQMANVLFIIDNTKE